jgi:hypothetical protein
MVICELIETSFQLVNVIHIMITAVSVLPDWK